MGKLGECTDVTIRIHNNSTCILERIILEELGRYDSYIVTASIGHNRDAKKLKTLLKRIPRNKLILI